jgi:Na+-translocating ferredoxin:NAD+ oxidoreductase RnfC subunit
MSTAANRAAGTALGTAGTVAGTTPSIDHIREAGVVGAGGAGFPAHVKLAATAETLIINAAECEPLIRVDQQLLLQRSADFLKGLAVALGLTGAQKAHIAIKAKHREVITTLTAALKAAQDKNPALEKVGLFELGDYYPAGDEQILVHDVLGKVVPRGGIPLAVGCVVSNVETIINVARAAEGIPVTTTFVTITGAVSAPATYELPIGISYREALALASGAQAGAQAGATNPATANPAAAATANPATANFGLADLNGKVLIDGGPMMGTLVETMSAPITKTTKALILLDANKRLVLEKIMTDGQILRQSRTACEQCQKCTDLCPRELLGHDVKPHLIMRIANYGISDFSGMKRAWGCSECGACALYACPCGLSPRRVNMLIKQQLAEAGVKNDASEAAFAASSMFEYRKIPTKRLIARLGLYDYDRPAPLAKTTYEPEQVTLLLKQHLGAPAEAVVAKGDSLQAGALVARIAKGALGANVHASISGTVTAVSDAAVTITRQ